MPRETATAVAHVIVRGHVQGVGFRAFVERKAAGLGLAGWVRNRRDGSVEAVVAGAPGDVAEMLRLLRKGPPGCRVDGLEEREPPVAGELPNSFEVRPTA